MIFAPIPKNEKERLVSLHKLGLLDTQPEKRFDLITYTATKIFQVPISTLTLVDATREWFKSYQGLSKREGDRAISFCGHALLSQILVVSDTTKDLRFADNPLVTGEPYVRFYAGIPLFSVDRQRVGVFCIKDTQPRNFSKDDHEILQGLAHWAEKEINYHNLVLAIQEERKRRTEFQVQTQKLQQIDTSREESKKAILNVMEDLEAAQKMIELEKAKDEAMLASIGEGLIAVDNQRKVMVINKSAEEILGWKGKNLLGKEITGLSLEDEVGHLLPLEKRPTYIALTTGTSTSSAYFFVRKDKTKFPIAITVTPIKQGDKTIGAIVIFRDITHEQEIDKAKSEFVSLASHQLRTPLGIIKWYLEALQNEDYFRLAPEPIRKYFVEIYKSNERLLSLMRDLLSVSRIEQGRVKNLPKSVDILQQISEVVTQMRILAVKKNISLTLISKDRQISPITIDPLRFNEVIQNLIANAIDYTVAPGKVDVIVTKQGDALLISVKDTGFGMSEADQKKLFTKFFRSEKAVEHNSEGSGLGLYVVKSYVEGWGGKILVESKEGIGSTFTVSLPMLQKKELRKEEP